MTAGQRDALLVMNKASAKLLEDTEKLNAKEAELAQAQAIREGIQQGGLAAAQQKEYQLGLEAVALRKLVQIDDTVAERNAELAFEQAFNYPGPVVG